ncbi:NFACT RNA binding domain-containing protein [Fulvivirgaceae bacterium BMA10]|uniref:NFACT RNA binding domain-containing protein n=1 Tax=Splendidivirga corallicola TaxID=3051826 RepID=A0ABT8KIA9_9BACT|nr:NFACT RNA binding domain-containing protein [Fulvivirgaceae bacterium BMA10]
MHNNYHFLKQLVPELRSKLSGHQLLTCFSQQKDELILGFSDHKDEFYIKATLQSDFCCLSFPRTFARARKNSIDLFGSAIDDKVIKIRLFENERAFAIYLEHNVILFKMHGNRSNVLLFRNQDDEPVLFKKNLINDRSIDLNKLDRSIDQTNQNFIALGCDIDPIFPTFGKLAKEQLDLKHYNQKSSEEKWVMVQGLVNELESPPYYITRLKSKIVLSLFETGDIFSKHTDAITALNDYYYLYTKTNQLQKEKSIVLKSLTSKLSKGQNYLTKTKAKFEQQKIHSKYEEHANIIMANLHQIPSKVAEVELYDFYNDRMVNIKLKRDLSPQKNAENYYRKSRNHKIEVDTLEKNIQKKQKELDQLKEYIASIGKINNIKELRSFLKENDLQNDKGKKIKSLPYRKFEYMGYDIFVGKSASSNDILTQKYAFKEDLWLHARDVSGSHVVIKYQAGKKFPKEVIERGAELAGFYSKRKNDDCCPVIYTQKKYVRKPKSSPPGQVVVEKEEVILIAPKKD